jgi:hypothetical protein
MVLVGNGHVLLSRRVKLGIVKWLRISPTAMEDELEDGLSLEDISLRIGLQGTPNNPPFPETLSDVSTTTHVSL